MAGVTLPGFRRDLWSRLHPLLRVSHIARLPLARHGLHPCPFANPYSGAAPGGRGVSQHRSAAATPC